MDSLEEKTLSSDEVYCGNFLKIYKDKVKLPDGKLTTREYIKHPGAAAIIPLLNNGKVIIERQWRYPARKAFLEIPAGKLDPNEEPLMCAKRELQEETGFVASDWIFLGKINNALGYSNESIWIYLARGLEKREQHLDPGEFVEIKEIPWEDLVKKSINGEITDVKTIIGAFWLEKYLAGSNFSQTSENQKDSI